MKTGKSREGLGAITTVNGAMWMQGEHGERGRTWGNKLTLHLSYIWLGSSAPLLVSTPEHNADMNLFPNVCPVLSTGGFPPKFCRG